MKSIIANNLSKVYQVANAQLRNQGLRNLIMRQLLSLFIKRESHLPFYALENVSFEIEQGDIVGLIGKNGSGKSTLLKILSRITSPSSGSAVLRGRVASLLEVGTGFHDELSGRENVFMSGVILGMKRWEISKNFDQIVDFAGVQKFIDVPIKQYSSGMRLRLAFSVAAHLQSEILLVDEVLAVGDYEFEKKCMNMMETVAVNHGRTVILVSHNLPAIRRLCKNTLYLSKGKLAGFGPTQEIASLYTMGSSRKSGIVQWDEQAIDQNDYIKIFEVKTTSLDGTIRESFEFDEGICIAVSYKVDDFEKMFSIMLWFYDEYGTLLFTSLDTSNKSWYRKVRKNGVYTSTCVIPPSLLRPGKVSVTLYFIETEQGLYKITEEIITFQVIDSLDMTSVIGDWRWQWPNVTVRPALSWNIEYKQ